MYTVQALELELVPRECNLCLVWLRQAASSQSVSPSTVDEKLDGRKFRNWVFDRHTLASAHC